MTREEYLRAIEEQDGEWKTVGGRRVFFPNGIDGAEAMKLSGKFKTQNRGEEYTDSNGKKSIFRIESGEKFKKALDKAKEKRPEDEKWRVDNTSHSADDYDKMKTYVTKNGSVVAVTNDGDIVSVCKAEGDRGRTLLEFAVKNGGKKLDSYEGNFEVYTHCGFEPVSWCKFEEQYAPSDWRKGKDMPEPIVFFKYKGGKVNITREEFYKNIKVSKDYDEAMKKRDKEIK